MIHDLYDTMPPTDVLTLEQYISGREDLPEGGRWTELEQGRLITLEPPPVEHGTAILNLSKALATFTQQNQSGYACFDLGLVLAHEPPTVRFPAISYFVEGPRFAESDKVVTETRPALVTEVASTNDRRSHMEERVQAWLNWGVRLVWVLDPVSKEAHHFEPGRAGRHLGPSHKLSGGQVLQEFLLPLEELFREPGWYR